MSTNNQNIYQPALEGEGIVSQGKFTFQTNAASIAAGAVVVKAAPGRLCRVLVSTALANSTPVVFYDNASAGSGTVIGYLASNLAVGTVTDFEMPANSGITIAQAANLTNAVITISYV